MPSEPFEVEIVVELERAVVPVPDAYALRGQGQLAFDQVSHACKVTTKLGAEEWGLTVCLWVHAEDSARHVSERRRGALLELLRSCKGQRTRPTPATS